MNQTKNQRQLQLFKQIRQYFISNQIEIIDSSISNSGAIEQKVGLEETYVRPGLLAYGQTSVLKNDDLKIDWNGRLIGSLRAQILSLKEIQKGTPIGYGAQVCPDSGLLAIIGLGYGDGFSCAYQGTEFDFEGNVGKIVGRVNMDMTQILFPKNTSLKVGQWIELWGTQNSNLENFCRRAKKIPYEVFCNLSPRLPREYIG
ncbi:MAG: hypothetical protein D6707_03795 [Bacteroidetes bacterium]|nr:MAG: hypothetical protein D6707_03795 [Bacteroidota bacterium]